MERSSTSDVGDEMQDELTKEEQLELATKQAREFSQNWRDGFEKHHIKNHLEFGNIQRAPASDLAHTALSSHFDLASNLIEFFSKIGKAERCIQDAIGCLEDANGEVGGRLQDALSYLTGVTDMPETSEETDVEEFLHYRDVEKTQSEFDKLKMDVDSMKGKVDSMYAAATDRTSYELARKADQRIADNRGNINGLRGCYQDLSRVVDSINDTIRSIEAKLESREERDMERGERIEAVEMSIEAIKEQIADIVREHDRSYQGTDSRRKQTGEDL